MINKNLSLLLSALFGFIFLLGVVNGAGTVIIQTPTSGATLTGLFVINVTNSTDFPSMQNCTLSLGSTLTANTSVSLGTIKNNTAYSYIIVNSTFNGTAVEDANNYVLTASCRNASNDVATTTATGLIIQNTQPTAPSSITPASGSSVTSAETKTFSGTVVDRTTTSCSYTLARGGATSGSDYISGTGTYATTSCSFTKDFNTSRDNGLWYWSMISSDGTDTATSSGTLDVALPGTGGGIPPVECPSGTILCSDGLCRADCTSQTQPTPVLLPIIIILFIALVMYIILKK